MITSLVLSLILGSLILGIIIGAYCTRAYIRFLHRRVMVMKRHIRAISGNGIRKR